MSTQIWGPDLWHILHTVAKSYPMRPTLQDKNIAYQLVKYVALIVPCKNCQKHYITNFTKNKPSLDNGPDFFKWTVKMHNHVNKATSKRQYAYMDAYNITPDVLHSKKMTKLFTYLVKESNYGNVSKMALQRFIDCLTYLSRYSAGNWSPSGKKDVFTVKQRSR